MNRSARNLRKALDSAATNNEAAAVDVMRAIDQLSDELLRQRLLGVVHRLNQDASELRQARDDVSGVLIKLA
ncbi:hypothetical protein [Pseudomonas brassicacearum]|uniref:hypothetical protein n=1 Tax=Pseudomonas brassicacearum TaxID=930166 RepID=UPI000F495A04|nr:hypothetical protein [Pseudomonas brassicacearum]